MTELSGVDTESGQVLTEAVDTGTCSQHKPRRVQNSFVACRWKMLNPDLFGEPEVRPHLSGPSLLGRLGVPGVNHDGSSGAEGVASEPGTEAWRATSPLDGTTLLELRPYKEQRHYYYRRRRTGATCRSTRVGKEHRR